MEFQTQFDQTQAEIEAYLKQVFQGAQPRADLYDAMSYSLLAVGKRIRPILTLETCRMCGGDVRAALPFACAVEMIHTYSLIHDDLPCMDNDDLRRGRPTNHKVYGEATAMLAGDGLLTAAFEVMAAQKESLPAERIVEAISCLANAAGGNGMVGGQALDLAGEGHYLSEEDLREIHTLKTGALICAAAELGCIVAGAGQEQRSAVRTYAAKLGLAFQIRDDMLDVEGSTEEFGKTVGSDKANGKNTFATLKGLEACRQSVRRLTEQAVKALEPFEKHTFLQELAYWLEYRTK